MDNKTTTKSNSEKQAQPLRVIKDNHIDIFLPFQLKNK